MPQYFCSNEKCGAAIQYSVAKPEKCPKCGKRLGVALVVKASIVSKVNPPAPPPVAPVEEDEEDYRKPLVVPRRAVRAKVGNGDDDDPDLPSVNADITTADLTDDEADAAYDKRAARRLAREMLAKLNPDDFRVLGEDEDKPIRFGDLVRQAQASQP